MSGKKYKSPSVGKDVTGAQYLTELLMTRKYQKKNKTLPKRFWSDERYKKEWLLTIMKVNALFKTYEEKHVIRALVGPKGRFIYSLNYPGLDKIILECQKEDSLKEKSRIENKDVSNEKPIKKRGKKTTLSKLKELE